MYLVPSTFDGARGAKDGRLRDLRENPTVAVGQRRMLFLSQPEQAGRGAAGHGGQLVLRDPLGP